MPQLTLAQIKRVIGDPVVFLSIFDKATGKTIFLTDADLSPTALQEILQWVNNHIGNV